MVVTHARQSAHRRGFTLLESLSAAGILLMIVIAVTTAVSAGQQHAFEANQRIAATMAAEELMGRLSLETYTNLPRWDGFTESVGRLTTIDDGDFPDTSLAVGRDVQVRSETRTISEVGVTIEGNLVTVRAFDRDGRTLSEVTRFVPEPASP